MDNVLDLIDQAVFDFEHATGANSRGQVVWIYNRAVDLDGLRRFHHHLQRGRLSRRIERSPLPFGRHRWVTSEPDDLEIATPRPRDEFDDWLSEQANRPLDVEHGSPWHLAVLPFTDGGAGVSLVASHTVADGMGGCMAVAEAAAGYDDAIAVPSGDARRRWRAVRRASRQFLRDIPAIRRALAAAARSARGGRRGTKPVASQVTSEAAAGDGDEPVTLPTATVFVDADAWTAQAERLGGTGNSLLAGVAARLADRAGRVTPDGSVTLGIPVNTRTADDTRANAVTNVDVTVDATRATTDLRPIRSATKQALIHRDQVPDERMALLPLVPLLPKRLVRKWVNVYTPSTTSVASSQLGCAPAIVNRPDGTDADYISLLSVCPGLTQATVQLSNGLMGLISAEVNGRVFVSVLAYQPDSITSKAELMQTLSEVMADFNLPATIGWPAVETASQTRN